MCRPFAPIDILRPISRVRSVTETYMMFMMPIPPTSREMPAMQASSTVIRSVVELSIELSSSCERISKSSSSPGLILWFCLRISAISSIALSDASSVRAERKMPCR